MANNRHQRVLEVEKGCLGGCGGVAPRELNTASPPPQRCGGCSGGRRGRVEDGTEGKEPGGVVEEEAAEKEFRAEKTPPFTDGHDNL
jgi:hypothetical protein